MNGEFCFTSEPKIDEQSGLTIHDSHKKRSIEVMANLPDCRSGTASSKCKAFVNSNEKIYVVMNNLA